jgi:hypothetical protein
LSPNLKSAAVNRDKLAADGARALCGEPFNLSQGGLTDTTATAEPL